MVMLNVPRFRVHSQLTALVALLLTGSRKNKRHNIYTSSGLPFAFSGSTVSYIMSYQGPPNHGFLPSGNPGFPPNFGYPGPAGVPPVGYPGIPPMGGYPGVPNPSHSRPNMMYPPHIGPAVPPMQLNPYPMATPAMVRAPFPSPSYHPGTYPTHLQHGGVAGYPIHHHGKHHKHHKHHGNKYPLGPHGYPGSSSAMMGGGLAGGLAAAGMALAGHKMHKKMKKGKKMKPHKAYKHMYGKHSSSSSSSSSSSDSD